MINILAIVELLLAVYLLYAAISGKSKGFRSAYVKRGMEPAYKKTGRIGYGIIGVLVLVLGVINLIASIMALNGGDEAVISTLGSIGNVLTWVTLTALLVLYLLFRRMHDKEKKNAPARSTAPRAAFFFDEEEAGKGALNMEKPRDAAALNKTKKRGNKKTGRQENSKRV